MTELLSDIEAPSDAELISRVRGGDVAAYGELFSRHVAAANRLGRQLARGPDVDDLVSEAFAKVLQVLQAGGGPDVAFRAYLLTSVRRLHVDRIRAGAKLQTSDDMSQFDPGIPFQDTAIADFENGAAAKAFASLPERWQLVLWHLEVEGQKPAEIAPLLGMSANSVSALAYRAREGLRQAFLTMHLADTSAEQCRWVNEHLGAYVRKGLSRRDTSKVEEHLDECRRCTGMYLELSEVNSNLAGIITPLLLGAAATGYLASSGTAGASGVLALVGRVRDLVAANTTAATAGAVAAGVAAVATGGFLIATAGNDDVVASADRPIAAITSVSPNAAPPPELPSASSGVSAPAAPATTAVASPSNALTSPAALVPVLAPGSASPAVGSTPGTVTAPGVVTVPGTIPGIGAGDGPGSAPGDGPGSAPGDGPGSAPGDGPGSQPGNQPGDGPGTQPGDGPGTDPGTKPGPAPTGPTTTPGGPGEKPTTGGPKPDPSTSPDPGAPADPATTVPPPVDTPSDPSPGSDSGPGTNPGNDEGDNPGGGGTTDPGTGAEFSIDVLNFEADDTALRIALENLPADLATVGVDLVSKNGTSFASETSVGCVVVDAHAECSPTLTALGAGRISARMDAPSSYTIALPLTWPELMESDELTVTVTPRLRDETNLDSTTFGPITFTPPRSAPSPVDLAMVDLVETSHVVKEREEVDEFHLTSTVEGIPDSLQELTFTLSGDASFAADQVAGCNHTSATTMTCSRPHSGWPSGQSKVHFVVWVAGDQAETVTIDVRVPHGYVDSNLQDNDATIKLTPKAAEEPGEEDPGVPAENLEIAVGAPTYQGANVEVEVTVSGIAPERNTLYVWLENADGVEGDPDDNLLEGAPGCGRANAAHQVTCPVETTDGTTTLTVELKQPPGQAGDGRRVRLYVSSIGFGAETAPWQDFVVNSAKGATHEDDDDHRHDD